MADNEEPPRDKFPPLKVSAIVEGGHSILADNKLEEFIAYCKAHHIRFYVSREKLLLLKKYFGESKTDDHFTTMMKAAGNGCPPPTFECPQIDEG